VAEGEDTEVAEGDEPKKKGSKKKLIIMIVVLLLIGYEAASMTILKPPPPTPAQIEAKKAKEKNALETKCALANGLTPPPPLPDTNAKSAKDTNGTTTTTLLTEATPAGESLPVLVLDPVTINLADNKFLKLGVGFQFPAKTLVDTIKVENPGAAALSYVITSMRKKASTELGPNALEPLRQQLGYQICTNPDLNGGGKILTIFFTDFVYQ